MACMHVWGTCLRRYCSRLFRAKMLGSLVTPQARLPEGVGSPYRAPPQLWDRIADMDGIRGASLHPWHASMGPFPWKIKAAPPQLEFSHSLPKMSGTLKLHHPAATSPGLHRRQVFVPWTVLATLHDHGWDEQHAAGALAARPRGLHQHLPTSLHPLLPLLASPPSP